ncbi:hypothetical protein ACJJIQ_15380 [Microbulbifer sp. ANSA003]|uniref:hypothetical protein n=1 Tax=Microbulbifer sp. ANSA003 TaxID=3243360 RepID=UPI0040425F3A
MIEDVDQRRQAYRKYLAQKPSFSLILGNLMPSFSHKEKDWPYLGVGFLQTNDKVWESQRIGIKNYKLPTN